MLIFMLDPDYAVELGLAEVAMVDEDGEPRYRLSAAGAAILRETVEEPRHDT